MQLQRCTKGSPGRISFLVIPLLFAVQWAWVVWLLSPLATRWTRRLDLNNQRRPPHAQADDS